MACTSQDKKDSNQETEDSLLLEDEGTLHCASGGTAVSYNDGWLLEGSHYSLYSKTSQAESEEMSKMIESSFTALEEWFQHSPQNSEPLVVEVYQNEGDWADAISTDGLDVPYGAGGYYHPTTRKAYLYTQPTQYYTRQLLIHEVIHQFHDLIRSSTRDLPGWYVEGIAEYLSMYDWDGSCIRLGRLPLITQEDMPQKALQESGALSLSNHFQESDSISRPLEWAMFRYFDLHYGAKWDEFRYQMDEGEGDASSIFEDVFDDSLDAFEAPLISWLEEEQQPFVTTYLEWCHIDSENIEGWSDVFSIAPLKLNADEFSVHVSSFESLWTGGVLLSFDDTANWTSLVVNEDGSLQTFEVIEGTALWWDQGTVSRSEVGYTISVLPENGAMRVLINGEEHVFPIIFEPTPGLALNGSEIQFSEIRWIAP